MTNKTKVPATIKERVTLACKYIIMIGSSVRKIKAKLKMPKRDLDFLARSRTMYAAQIENRNGYFTPPFQYLEDWEKQIKAFDSALKKAKRVKGMAGEKNTKKNDLKDTHAALLDYVNYKVRKNPRLAAEIIAFAMMYIVKIGKKNKQDFTVESGDGINEAILRCIEYKINGKRTRASYEWEQSIDGGETWMPLPNTTKAKTVAKNLQKRVKYIFRKRITTTKHGTTGWVVSKVFYA